MSIINVGFVVQGSEEEFDVSTLELGLMASSFSFGLLLSATITGIISDKFGRNYGFKQSVIIGAVSTYILLFSFNPGMVCASLFLVGLGVGGEISLGGVVFIEFCPPTKRHLTALMGISWGIGAILTSVFAYVIQMVNNTGFRDWRLIIAFSCIVLSVSAFFRFL